MADDPTNIAYAQPAPKGRYRADPNHSSVLWRIKHMLLAWYTGRFPRFSIELDFDPNDPEAMRVEALIEVGTVRTEYAGADKDWDRELAESGEYLNATVHPTARFVSSAVRRTGDYSADVTGDLTLRGVTRPVTLVAVYNGSMLDHFSGVPLIGFSARGTFNRSAFGLTHFLSARMPDEIEVIIEAELGLAR